MKIIVLGSENVDSMTLDCSKFFQQQYEYIQIINDTSQIYGLKMILFFVLNVEMINKNTEQIHMGYKYGISIGL